MRQTYAKYIMMAKEAGIERFVVQKAEEVPDEEPEEEKSSKKTKQDKEDHPSSYKMRKSTVVATEVSLVSASSTTCTKPRGSHRLMKGPRCSVCQQYCFMVEIHCDHCGTDRRVCGAHMKELCHSSPAQHYTFLQRVTADDLAELEEGLVERQKQIESWRRDVEQAMVDGKGRGSETCFLAFLPKRWKSLIDPDSAVSELLPDIKKVLEVRSSKPPTLSVALLQALVRTGKELGVPRKEMMPLERLLEQVSDCTLKLSASIRHRRKDVDEEMSLRLLLRIALEALLSPYAMDKELDSIFSLIKEVTDLRRQVCWQNVNLSQKEEPHKKQSNGRYRSCLLD